MVLLEDESGFGAPRVRVRMRLISSDFARLAKSIAASLALASLASYVMSVRFFDLRLTNKNIQKRDGRTVRRMRRDSRKASSVAKF